MYLVIFINFFHLGRLTPKSFAFQFVLSCDFSMEVLRNSPMIELNRRKLKTPPTGSRIGKQSKFSVLELIILSLVSIINTAL